MVLNPLVDLERVEGAEPDTIDISGVFLDVDESVMDADELTLTVTADEGLDASVESGTLVINYLPTAGGLLAVNLQASDMFGEQVSDTMYVNIPILNMPPAFEWTPVTEVIADSLYSEVITASDSDGDLLFFEAHILPEWLSFQDIGDNTSLLLGTPEPDDEGLHEVQITVSDGQASDTLSFTITVHPSDYLNVPPVWTSEPITEANQDELYANVMGA